MEGAIIRVLAREGAREHVKWDMGHGTNGTHDMCMWKIVQVRRATWMCSSIPSILGILGILMAMVYAFSDISCLVKDSGARVHWEGREGKQGDLRAARAAAAAVVQL